MSTVGDSLNYLPNKFTLTLLPLARLAVKFYDHLSVSCNYTLLNNFSVYVRESNIIITNPSYIFFPFHSHL